MRDLLINIFLNLVFTTDRVTKILKIPNVEPNEKTLTVFNSLKNIYIKAEDNNIKLWVTGSWAITGRNNGKFIKQIEDIDFTMKERSQEKQFADLLIKLDYHQNKNSPMGANNYINEEGISIDFGSITYPGTIYYNISLDENEKVKVMDFEFRVIPIISHKAIYKNIMFSQGRDIKKDLIKLKILNKN